MIEARRFSIALFFGTAVMLSAVVSVAEDSATGNSDALYAEAAAAAERGDRAGARRLAVEVLVVAPDYADATVLLARLDGWEGRYAPARAALARVIERDPENVEARKALVDVEYWSGDHERAAELCVETRRLLPNDDALRTRCSQVARAAKVEPAATVVAARSTTLNPRPKRDEKVAATYRTSLDYTSQSFDSSLDSWHTVSLASERRDDRAALIGRASYVNRFGESALQLDAEAYPTLGEKTYAHLLTSYATGDVLHDFKLWAEIYQGLVEQMEGSLGIRWSVYADDVVSVTGTLGRHWKRWFFQGRFLVDTRSGESAAGSGSVRARFAFDDPEESLTGTVVFGNRIELDKGPPQGAPAGTPDDVRLFKIESTGLQVQWRKPISPRYIAKLNFGTEFQEIEGNDRTQFLAGVGFEHLF